MTTVHQLQARFDNLHQLYRAYMPFITHGGLFIASNDTFTLGAKVKVSCILPDSDITTEFDGVVVWLNPLGAQGGRPVGAGIQISENDKQIRAMIETQLSSKLASVELTSTM